MNILSNSQLKIQPPTALENTKKIVQYFSENIQQSTAVDNDYEELTSNGSGDLTFEYLFGWGEDRFQFFGDVAEEIISEFKDTRADDDNAAESFWFLLRISAFSCARSEPHNKLRIRL